MKPLFLMLVFLVTSLVAQAQQWSYTANLADVTVSGTAAAVFSAADINAGGGHVQATQAVCSLTTANIRVTLDGTTPTSSYGQVLTPGVWVFQSNAVLNGLRAIRDDATSGVLSCSIQG